MVGKIKNKIKYRTQVVHKRKRISVTISDELIERLDDKIKLNFLFNRSRAVEYYIKLGLDKDDRMVQK